MPSTMEDDDLSFLRPPPAIRWHFLQVLGVCTCFVGYRTIALLPGNLLAASGTYFIPYYIGMLAIVLPVLFVQLKLGGSTQKNLVAIFSRYTPIIKGIGIACVFRFFIHNVFSNVYVAYAIYYAASSLMQPFPWATCGNVWNSPECDNSTSSLKVGSSMPEQQFFDDNLLQLSGSVSMEGTLPWRLGVCLVAAWGLTFLLVSGGVRYFGWMMSVTGGISMVIAMALLAYSREELPHSLPETNLYRSDWQRLVAPTVANAFFTVWTDGLLEGVAIVHLWQGVLPTIGKYTSHGSSWRVNGAWVVFFLFVCVVPHLFVVMMGTLAGPLATGGGVTLGSLLESGPRMLFVVLPASLHHLSLGRGLAFIIYLMVGLLWANSQALFTMAAVENIDDWLENTMRKCCVRRMPRFFTITAAYCVLGLVLGIPNITQSGFYLVQLLAYAYDRFIFLVVFISMIGFAEAYAKQPFSLCHRVCMLIWFLMASILTTVLTFFGADLLTEPREIKITIRHGITYTYPAWGYILSWFIGAGPIAAGLLYGVLHAYGSAKGQGRARCINSCTGQPDEESIHKTSHHGRSVLSDTSGNSEYLKPEQY